MSIYDCQIVYHDSSMRLVEVRIMWYRRRSLHHCGEGGMDFYVSLGARLKAFRVRAGLSQADLGARLGRSASAINRYETGQRRLPAEDLIRLAELRGAPHRPERAEPGGAACVARPRPQVELHASRT